MGSPLDVHAAGFVDVSLRAQAFAELASGAIRAVDLAGLGRAVALVPPRAGITPRSNAGGITLELAPPITPEMLTKLLGWSENAFDRADVTPRLGAWTMTVPPGGRSAAGITALRLEPATTEATVYVSGADPWRVSGTAPAGGAASEIARRVASAEAAPATVGELETALGLTLDPAGLRASSMGRLAVAPIGSPLIGVTARYAWFPERELAVADLDELRRRALFEWSATFSEGFETLDAALSKRFGEPALRNGHRVYSSWILDGSPGRSCSLTWYAKPPDWTTAPMPRFEGGPLRTPGPRDPGPK